MEQSFCARVHVCAHIKDGTMAPPPLTTLCSTHSPDFREHAASGSKFCQPCLQNCTQPTFTTTSDTDCSLGLHPPPALLSVPSHTEPRAPSSGHSGSGATLPPLHTGLCSPPSHTLWLHMAQCLEHSFHTQAFKCALCQD